MKILIIANHYVVASGRYITDAFKRLGHDVRHTGEPMGRKIWGLTLPESCVWTPDSIEDGWLPELIVVADSDPSLNPLLYQYRGTNHPNAGGVPTVVYGVDNHVRNTYQHFWADHYFLAHRNVSMMRWDWPENELRFGTIGQPQFFKMTHLPCAYDPTLHTPSAIPYAERAYDVCMLGYVYPQRLTVIKALQAAGVKVLWGCGLVGESYAQAYQNSRISLCLSAAHDVGQRIFETAAMGCCVLSDPCPDFDILKPEGVIILDDPARIVEDVLTILGQPSVAQTAIEKSMRWVNGHTWDARAEVVLEWAKKQALYKSGVLYLASDGSYHEKWEEE